MHTDDRNLPTWIESPHVVRLINIGFLLTTCVVALVTVWSGWSYLSTLTFLEPRSLLLIQLGFAGMMLLPLVAFATRLSLERKAMLAATLLLIYMTTVAVLQQT